MYVAISNHNGRYGAGWNAPRQIMPNYIRDLYQEDYNQLVGL